MRLKEYPDDFVVDEIFDPVLSGGQFAIVKITKREMTTLTAVRLIAERCGIPIKAVGYAGIKDRNAVTTQHLSLEGVSKEMASNLVFENLFVAYLGHSKEAISIGGLAGNRFTITVRDLREPLQSISAFPNYFDTQRFSEHNVEIGIALLKGQFKDAVDIILSSGKETTIEKNIADVLAKRPTDAIGALRSLPPDLLQLYISAVQSRLFNDLLAARLRTAGEHIEVEEDFGTLVFPVKAQNDDGTLPLIGFSTRETPQITQALSSYGLTTRSFIIRSLPTVSSPGTQRKIWSVVRDLSLGDVKDGVQTVSFSLGKGSYATMAVRAMANRSKL